MCFVEMEYEPILKTQVYLSKHSVHDDDWPIIGVSFVI